MKSQTSESIMESFQNLPTKTQIQAILKTVSSNKIHKQVSRAILVPMGLKTWVAWDTACRMRADFRRNKMNLLGFRCYQASEM